MMSALRAFAPYLRLLFEVPVAFVGALFAGGLAAFLSGFGLAFVTQQLLPFLYQTPGLEWWQIGLAAASVPAVMAVRALAQFTNAYLMQRCGLHILERLRAQAFNKLQEVHLGYFHTHPTGDMLSRVVNDTATLQNAVSRVANDLIVQPVTLLSSAVFLIYLAVTQAELGFVFLALCFIPLSVLPLRVLSKHLGKRAREMQERLGGVTEYVRENLAAAREVRAFGLQERQKADFAALVRDYLRVQLKVVKYTQSISPSIEVVSAAGIALAIFAARMQGVSFDQIVPLIIALYFAYDPVKKLGVVGGFLKAGQGALQRLEEVLQAPVEVADQSGAIEVREAAGRLDFEDVSFAYSAGGPPVLRGVSATLEAGKTYALVGPSGAGKTTFANLIPRFFDPTAGRVLLDGRDLKTLTLSSLRRQIALVSQDSILFHASVADNLRVGRPGATEEEVRRAAEAASAAAFVAELPEGYATRAGERGSRFSGGQRQRLALARAFLKDAPILLLDEATSALDSRSEEAIQKALAELRQGRTAVLIAHRFSSIALADEILVFHEGQIVQRGPHARLLAEGGLYAELYRRQGGR